MLIPRCRHAPYEANLGDCAGPATRHPHGSEADEAVILPGRLALPLNPSHEEHELLTASETRNHSFTTMAAPQSHAFVSQLSSSVVVSVPSPPSPDTTPRHSASFEYAATLDFILHFKRLPRGRARNGLLRDLLDHCERDELLLISTLVGPRLKRDFLAELPAELALHVLAFVDDAQTLARIACVSKVWRGLLHDEHLWRAMSHRYNFNLDLPEPARPASSFRRQFKTAFTTGEQSPFSWTASHDGAERNWRRGGRLVKVNRTPDEGVVTSLAMDDEWIVLGLNHNYVNLYDARSGAKRHTLLGHQQGVWAIALVSKGGRLLDPSEYAPVAPAAPIPHDSDDPVTLPALGLGLGFAEESAPSFEGHDAPPEYSDEALRSDPCGATRGWGQPDALVVSGSSDRTVRVWNARTGQCVHVLAGHAATIRCMKALQARPLVVSGSRDSTLKVWDIERGALLHTMVGHTDSVRCLDVYGNQVVSGSYDCTLRVRGYKYRCMWGSLIRSCGTSTRASVCARSSDIRSPCTPSRTTASASRPAGSTRSRASGCRTTGTPSFPTPSHSPSRCHSHCVAMLQGHNSLICRLQLSPRTLCTGGADGRVLVFDLARAGAGTYALAHRLAPHALTSLAGLQFAAAGCLVNGMLVSAASDGRVVLTDLRSGLEVRELSDKCEQVWCVGFRSDRLVVVCLRHAKTVVELWSFRPPEEDDD